MRDAFAWSFDTITSINWLEVIKALAPVATAVIAYLALKNWRRQEKAKRAAEFLDTLIEAVDTYTAAISRPITILKLTKIGMASHAQGGDIAVRGAILYIQKDGEGRAKLLLEALEAIQPSVIKLNSLAAKGQMFKFIGYAKCQNTIAMLLWHFDRMGAFAAVIGSPTWNWEHPEVLKCLKDIMAIEPDEVRKSVEKNRAALHEFSGETYKRIYG